MPKFWQKYPEKKQGIVNLKTNSSFRGVIWTISGQFLVLRNAEMLSGDGVKGLDGEIILNLSDVEFIQVT